MSVGFQRTTRFVGFRCRNLLHGPIDQKRWINVSVLSLSRCYNTSAGPPSRSHPRESRQNLQPYRWEPSPVHETRILSKPFIDPNKIPAYFEADVKRWAGTKKVHQRLESFGIPKNEILPLLKAFVSAVQAGQLSTPEGFKKYGLIRFVQDISDSTFLSEIDVIYSTILYAWAADPTHHPALAKCLSPSTIADIQRLAQAASRSHPAEEFPAARKMHRKIIMHVGPTNSGKTHHALRALAAAGRGVYAGPLRLLAHEIWERLNLGQIVPLGVEDRPDTPGAGVSSSLDIPDVAPAAKKLGNPRYARACNMLTGEERKIVSPDAGLWSCTVEMLSTAQLFDVAVIDEIQMIADEQRGNGWTSAVLGICAKEVHLCGEATAVPLIRKMLEDTGDELIVKEYDRLTPLSVEESLDGDLRRVRKGDCIVTFRRSNIFALKRRVEEETGLRCAVVYGKLPPEIRSEQAALFNDPDSGYDVIIGSDAIGMGLNLKIRRIIFEAVGKWDGVTDRPLSVSQTKQIAGRAGRFGLHGDEQPGGFTTTLNKVDLPFLRKTLEIKPASLQHARIGPRNETYMAISNALPEGASTETIANAHGYIAQLPAAYRYNTMFGSTIKTMGEFIDRHGDNLTIADRVLHMLGPIPWRDETCTGVVSKFIEMFSEDMSVDLVKAVKDTNFLQTMLRIEDKMRAGFEPHATTDILGTLESFHKTLVVYLWMSFRNPVAYSKQTEVAELKKRLEAALEWALDGISKKPDDKKWQNGSPLKDTARQINYSSRTDPRTDKQKRTLSRALS